MVVVFTPSGEGLCRTGGMRHVLLANKVETFLDGDGKVLPEVGFFDRYVIMIPKGLEHIRDAFAIRIGDELCQWAYLPEKPEDVASAVSGARSMWTDEVATMDDVPDDGPTKTYKS